MANKFQYFESKRFGNNLYLYGHLVGVAADTSLFQWRVPKGMIIRIDSVLIWQDTGGNVSFTLESQTPSVPYGAVGDLNGDVTRYRHNIKTVATATLTAMDLGTQCPNISFGSETMIMISGTLANTKMNTIYMTCSILQDAKESEWNK